MDLKEPQLINQSSTIACSSGEDMLTIMISKDEEIEIIKKLEHKRELSRLRHARWYELHKDEITARKKAIRQQKVKDVIEKKEPTKRGRKPKPITKEDMLRLLLLKK